MAKITTITNPLTGQPAQVDQLDHTAQQIDDGLNIARNVSNPNLLDNWYFGNPVDQRQGRVVKPNTTYYSNNTLTTSAGTTSSYVTAYRYATGTANDVNYASFKLEDSDTAPTYYAAPENVVRGYTGAGYGIDRWKQLYDSTYCLIQDGYVSFYGLDFGQMIETKRIPLNTPLTYSVLTAEGILGSITFQFDGTQNQTVAPLIGETKFRANFIYNWGGTYTPFFLQTEGNVINVVAMKLELGSQQTLAHQENGVWVLNEIPDYGEQLARCQRYLFISGSIYINCESQVSHLAVPYFMPKMRTIPSCTVYSAPDADKIGVAKRTTNYLSGQQIDNTGDVWVNAASIGSSGGTLLASENGFPANQYVFKIVANAEL